MNKNKRPVAKILFKNYEEECEPSKKIYDAKDELEIRCINCEAKLKIVKRGQTYYFSANKRESHSEKCNEINYNIENHPEKSNGIDSDVNSLKNTIRYFLNPKKKDGRYLENYSKNLKGEDRIKYYEIKNMEELNIDINENKINIDKNYKFITKIKNIQVFDNYLYINGVVDISILIGSKNGINKTDIEKFKSVDENEKEGYVFCLGKLITTKSKKLQIKPKDDKLEYIYINRNNMLKLFSRKDY